MSNCAHNTDVELFRDGDGDGNGMSYYEPSLYKTINGRIGINVGGTVFENTLTEWHALALADVGGIEAVYRQARGA